MVQRNDDPGPLDRDLAAESDDQDDRLGEAIEEYLTLAEQGEAPDLEAFLARHEDMRDDLRAALEGLELVHGLVGRGGASSSWGGTPGGGASRWLESGRRIAGYRIVRELGRGGMGTVFEAVHVGLDRPVALKVLGTHAAPDSSARRRFLNEAKTAAGLHHTHIVPVFDVGQVGGLCYYAMQRIEGSGLDRVLRHLRRTRPPGSGPSGSSATGDGAGTTGSSFSSRIGQLWLRVSPGWLWRPGSGVDGPAGDGGPAGASLGSRSPREETASPVPPVRGGDSTASWGSHPLDAERGRNEDASGSAIALGSAWMDAKATGHTDEPPPYVPPRGSSYFRWVASVGLQAADALAHAHHHGVIHRDVKPSNLLIDAGGNIWVTDFGLARRLADPGLTHHDSLLGTPRYMSPEQARTAGRVDARTDVYSLGATLYELLTLRPPFDGQSAAELVDQIGRDEPLPPRSIDPRIPRDLETIVLKALAKRPVDRYATAAELGEDLARFLSYAPVKARRIGPVGRLWRVARRHPQIAAVTTTAAALILAIATYSYVRILDKQMEVSKALEIAKDKGKLLEESNAQLVATMRQQHLQAAQMLESLDGTDRRSQGLEQIRSAVALPGGVPDVERAAFRDEAVKFLVMRDVEARPALATGGGNAAAFGLQGNRLWVLSEDDERLSVWDVDGGRRLMEVPLRDGAVVEEAAPELVAGVSGGERAEAGSSGGQGQNRSASGGPGRSRRGSLAMVGNWVAAFSPARNAVSLIDPLSGTTVRRLTAPGQEVQGIIGDPTGRHLITIERAEEDPDRGEEAAEEVGWLPGGQYQLGLWDLERIDQPRTVIDPYPPRRGPGGGRQGASRAGVRPPDRPPLVAISPDGRTVAVAAFGAPWVRLYSAEDGSSRAGRPIDNQTEITALAMGPNGMMALAGHDQIRLYDIDNHGAFVTALKPRLTYTRLMRFGPTGALALAGPGGRIELWDPVAASRVAALPGTEQAVDLAFSPDGRTLAAMGRSSETSVWTIEDSAVRTQLSGFDAKASSLAFGPEGILAVGGWDGSVWTWKKGRCPQSGRSTPIAAAVDAEPVRHPESSTNSGDAEARKPSGPEPRSPGRGEREPGGRPRGPRGHGLPRPLEGPTSLAFDAEGRLLAHDNLGLRIWPAGPRALESAPTMHDLPPTPPPMFIAPMFIAGTADGRTMALLRAGSLYLWRIGEPDRLIPVVPPKRPATVGAAGSPLHFRAIQVAPDGARLFLIEMPGRLHVWDLAGIPGETSLQASEAEGALPPLESISTMALRGDGAVLAVGDRTGNVTLIDLARRTALSTIRPPKDEAASVFPALAFSGDGKSLAIGSHQGSISIQSVERPGSPRLRFRLPGHRGFVTSLAFDGPGARLASASWTDPVVVEVWDLELIDRKLADLGLGEPAGEVRSR